MVKRHEVPPASAGKSICVTRALKNAKHLQRVASQIMPVVEPPEGFASIIPHKVLAQLHTPEGQSAKSIDSRLQKLLKDVKFPSVGNMSGDPLFHGTLYFVRLLFTVQNQNNAVISVSAADVATAVQYAVQASPTISDYATQYGSNAVAVHQPVIPYAVSLPSASYNDAQLGGWVNDILSKNTLPSSACVVFLNPQGMVNTDADPSAGYGGYHGKAGVPYIFVNLFGQNLTVADEGFFYAQILSHEIAEMVVDPLVDGKNPEVCDPCGPNCQAVFLDYFNDMGYVATLQTFPPGFPYRFYINGIVQPPWATQCPAPASACDYRPPRFFHPPMIAHERNAAWLIELWLLIHGPDPAPIDLGGLGKDVRLLATVRAIAGLARCLGDVPAEQAILQALRPVVGRAGAQLREEF